MKNVIFEIGCGRLIFANTFNSAKTLSGELLREEPGKRDIVVYAENPHVIVSQHPNEIFIDPSDIYRLKLNSYVPKNINTRISRIKTKKEITELNKIYQSRGMARIDKNFVLKNKASRKIIFLVAYHQDQIVGGVMGLDHKYVTGWDGASLWSLAVDPQATIPGVGMDIVNYLISYFQKIGREFMDLSVMHDNKSAISLYTKLGFEKIKSFAVKKKNKMNAHLFTKPVDKNLTLLHSEYQLIFNEAQRRGINVKIIDKEEGYYRLSLGAKEIVCQGTLTDMISAISLSICNDKAAFINFLKSHDYPLPDEIVHRSSTLSKDFLRRHKTVIVKPSFGEKGKGVTLRVREDKELMSAIRKAQRISSKVILQRFIKGVNVRVIIIAHEVVSAAKIENPMITGDGKNNIKKLVEKLNRRRCSAAMYDCGIPFDNDTKATIEKKGYNWSTVLPQNKSIKVREHLNINKGAILRNITDKIDKKIKDGLCDAAAKLMMPIVAFDIRMPNINSDKYFILEAKARFSIKDHEPSLVPKKFIDFLFPQSKQSK
ncbi:GNAT family N-acetyltransferase [Candidatus Woesearchaeota archaeon]|nr:GNAT family N-acetyltransferase [Candidatus Woesearchaeota archaeon]